MPGVLSLRESSMTIDPILQAIADITTLYEGVAETSRANTLEVLLPEPVAKQLELDEAVTFTTSAEVREAEFVTYNSEILGKFEALLQQSGYISGFGVKYHGHLKSSGFDKAVSAVLHAENGLIRVCNAQQAITPYLLCNIAYSAEADEKRIGMVSFLANQLTGATPVDIGDALLWDCDRTGLYSQEDLQCMEFSLLQKGIEKTATRFVKQDMVSWHNSLQRKKMRDEERLNGYFNAIKREIRAKIRKKRLEGEAKQREIARIEATDTEAKRKYADIRARYAVRVEAQLHSAVVVHLPTVHVHCELVRKKYKRPVIVVWNPFSKQIEPLCCEKSGEAVYTFYLSDDKAKVIAPACYP